jgi:hypothetical protein
MHAMSPLMTGAGDTSGIAQRMRGILQDEIARGAPANIVGAAELRSAPTAGSRPPGMPNHPPDDDRLGEPMTGPPARSAAALGGMVLARGRE